MPGFDEESAARIANVVRRVEGLPVNALPSPEGARVGSYVKLGITTTSITARSSKTPGSGTVQPYTYNRDTNLLVLSGPTQTIKNWTGSTVATNKWVQFEVIDGKLWLNGTDCSGVAP